MDDTTRVLELQGESGSATVDDAGSVFFVGTATVLLRYAGITILTDPSFVRRGDQPRPVQLPSGRRLTQPAITFDELPPVDVVLLSHLSQHHFDRVAEQKLDHDVPIVTTPRAATALARRGFRNARGLLPWQSQMIAKGEHRVRVTATPAQRGPRWMSHLLSEAMGSVVDLLVADGSVGYRIYISGDTTLHDGLREVSSRYPAIDLGLFHLGGVRIMGVPVTLDAAQAVEAIRLVRPDVAIPIHVDDYPAFRSSMDEFQQHVRRAGLATEARLLGHGDAFAFEVPSARARAIPMPMSPGPELCMPLPLAMSFRDELGG